MSNVRLLNLEWKLGMTTPELILPQAMLFDMDGTLTEPLLDFPAIKAELGISNMPILEAIDRMPMQRRRQAEAILARHEEDAASRSLLSPGCVELLDFLKSRDIRLAMVTRNNANSVRVFFERHALPIDAVVSRDDGAYKPDPAALHLAVRKLGLHEPSCWMIGDGQFDIEAGLAAHMPTVWISLGRERMFDAQPWKTVHNLRELHARLASAT